MKTISTALKADLAGSVTTKATCWYVLRKDGSVFSFTDHDQPITVSISGINSGNPVTYAPNLSYTRTTIRTGDKVQVDTLDVAGVLNAATITDADLRAGRFNNAKVFIFLLNYAAIAHGPMKLRAGNIGQVKVGLAGFTAELRGLAQLLQTRTGRVYQPQCRVDVFSQGVYACKLNPDTYRETGTVTSVSATEPEQTFAATVTNATSHAQPGPRVITYQSSSIYFVGPNAIHDNDGAFVSQGFASNDPIRVTNTVFNNRMFTSQSVAAGQITTADQTVQSEGGNNVGAQLQVLVPSYWDLGELTWLTGANAGLSMEVKIWTGASGSPALTFVLFLGMPFPILVNDTFSITPGCDKLLNTCIYKFNNLNNFRGEPFVPGIGRVLDYPNAV